MKNKLIILALFISFGMFSSFASESGCTAECGDWSLTCESGNCKLITRASGRIKLKCDGEVIADFFCDEVPV
tara:strand:+ start:485 stop:700 length:216 start_codon:yes stop_codon:yes gene_type:complete